MFDPICLDPATKRTTWQLRDEAKPPYQPWRLPLQRIGNREPIVLSEYVTDARRGIELGYPPMHYDAELFIPVFAAQDGAVAFAGETPQGFAISLDHGHSEWSTHYAHLSRMFVTPYLGSRARRLQRVRAGEVIGYAAKSPAHVRFELWDWTNERGFVSVDPIATMKNWSVIPRLPEFAKEAA